MKEERRYVRMISVFEDHFINFKKTLDRETLKKIYQVFMLIMTVPVVPVKFLKPISGSKGLYEIRVEESGNIFRIFCCFDEGQLIILFNAIQKKTPKTPKEAIEKAEALRKKYFTLKEQARDESKR